MPNLFIDTSGWGDLFDSNQRHHQLATTLYRTYREQGYQMVTTNYVLTELVALLTSPLHTPRPLIIDFINALKTSSFLEIAHIDPELDQQAWELLATRPDKNWSLVDCSSFVFMKQRHIAEALTADHHFEQAGFMPLLKSQ